VDVISVRGMINTKGRIKKCTLDYDKHFLTCKKRERLIA
jgi:hypothetical protein